MPGRGREHDGGAGSCWHRQFSHNWASLRLQGSFTGNLEGRIKGIILKPEFSTSSKHFSTYDMIQQPYRICGEMCKHVSSSSTSMEVQNSLSGQVDRCGLGDTWRTYSVSGDLG